MVDFFQLKSRYFEDQGHAEVHDGADWGEIVERYERIHLVLLRAQQTLYHDEPDGFEDDASDLEQEANQDESDFSERGNDNTDYDERDVEQLLKFDFLDLEEPASDEDRNWGCSLLEMSG